MRFKIGGVNAAKTLFLLPHNYLKAEFNPNCLPQQMLLQNLSFVTKMSFFFYKFKKYLMNEYCVSTPDI